MVADSLTVEPSQLWTLPLDVKSIRNDYPIFQK
ncbi:uncharacterized protein METZ01_LOCUS190492, partial [marine metagenome]